MPHTPGPWTIREEGRTFSDKPNGVFRIDAPSGLPVASAKSPKWDRREAKRNALLVSAAPELLEALKDIQANLTGRDYFWERVERSLETCKEAIAKAEGK